MTHGSIDTSDIERWMGRPVGGEQLREPVTRTDVLRWVQAMRNPDPACFDPEWQREQGLETLRVPQSMILACSVRHGVQTSMQGEIPGGRQMNGGDEWWFKAPLSIGDRVTSRRRALDFRMTETAFAGPTVFQRGEIEYLNQDGTLLARQISTSIRFLAANLKAKDNAGRAASKPPTLRADHLAAFEAQRVEYARRLRSPQAIDRAALAPGLKLAVRPVGPHSIQSFTTEQRAFLYTVWGNLTDDGLERTPRRSRPEAAFDPEFADGLYHGASAGHTDSSAAAQRGMSRAYGAGASACAWLVDFVSHWTGTEGTVTHCKVQYRNPILLGDLTLIHGEVAAVEEQPDGTTRVELSLRTENQDGKPGAIGTATVHLAPNR